MVVARYLHRIWRRLAVVVIALSALLPSTAARALDPFLDVSKYGHTAWRNLDGFGPGTIGPITQTTDGYLWLGTPSGLLRFDGVRSVPWRAPLGSALPDERVRTLLGTRDGSLWIGTYRGLASLQDGKLRTLSVLRGLTVNALTEDSEGTVWVGGVDGKKGFLCAVRREADHCQAVKVPITGAIAALTNDSKGSVWAAGGNVVWRAFPASADTYRLEEQIGETQAMDATPDDSIAVGTKGKVVRVRQGSAEAIALPAWAQTFLFTKILCDRDGGLWIAAADFGLLHVHEGRTDVYTAADGLTGGHVLGLFEDREGNIWVSTSHGLDRFRSMATAIYSGADGIKGRVASVLVAHDGSLWASTTVGVYRLQNEKASEVWRTRSATLFEDRKKRIWVASQYELGYFAEGRLVAPPGLPRATVDGIAEDSEGSIWFAYRDEGLLRLLPNGEVERTAWKDLDMRGPVSTMVIDPSDDSLWLGTWTGSIMNVHKGQLRSVQQLRERPGGSAVSQLRLESDGSLWVASRAVLTWVKNGRANPLDSESGMPCDGAFWTQENDRSIWIYTSCGLVEIARTEMDAWRKAKDSGASRKVKYRLLDQGAGVGQPANVSAVGQIARVQLFTPKAARTPDGRIWFVTGDGVTAVDPQRIPFNNIAPPLQIEQIVVDGTVHEPQVSLRLPPQPRDLRIEYTALSLTAPEKVRFRYRLEGRDIDWQDVGSRRQAFYTDLAPGRYVFRVIAANQDGVWNEEGAALAFSVPPAWYQTAWFRALCALAACALLFAMYRARVRQVSLQIRGRLEARLAERERIARELHDTLLQGMQGLILRFQAMTDRIPSTEPSRKLMEQSLDRAEQLLAESRDKVKDLRPSAQMPVTLAEALLAEGAQVASLLPQQFRVKVLGTPKELHPIAREEGFLIAREAIANAFKHARASEIEIEIVYGDDALQVCVRDDGQGMEDTVRTDGRLDHFGMLGMRERAQKLGATLEFWSKLGAGTEAALRVPAKVAYLGAASTTGRVRRWLHSQGTANTRPWSWGRVKTRSDINP